MTRRRGWRRTVQAAGRLTVNRPAVVLLRLGLPWPPYTPRSALVVETMGRRSGRSRLTPVGYHRAAPDRLLVVAEHGARADWVRNALAAGEVTVWIGRERRRARVGLTDGDPSQVLRAIGNRLHAATVRLLAHEPRVVELRLLPR